MGSPVVSASDPKNRSTIKGFGRLNGRPCQICDIVIQIEKDFELVRRLSIYMSIFLTLWSVINLWTLLFLHHLILHEVQKITYLTTLRQTIQFIKLLDVKLSLIGAHQLQNATAAACAALCLRDQGDRFILLFFFVELETWNRGRGENLSGVTFDIANFTLNRSSSSMSNTWLISIMCFNGYFRMENLRWIHSCWSRVYVFAWEMPNFDIGGSWGTRTAWRNYSAWWRLNAGFVTVPRAVVV